MVVYGVALGVSGAGEEQIAAAADFSSTDSWQFYAGTLLGLAFSVLGGYVCARVARRNEMRLGAVTAALSAVLGLLISADQFQLGTNLSMTLAAIIAVMTGARLGQARNRGTK
jgi:CHASE2 domain-containing sensor protein